VKERYIKGQTKEDSWNLDEQSKDGKVVTATITTSQKLNDAGGLLEFERKWRDDF
jgi:hypothetical protein